MPAYTAKDATQGLSKLAIDANQQIQAACAQALKTAGDSADSKRTAAAQVADVVKASKAVSLNVITTQLSEALEDKKNPLSRENACYIVTALATKVGGRLQAYLYPLLESLLVMYSDKVVALRAVADEASRALLKASANNSVKYYLPLLFGGLERAQKWQTKEGALKLLAYCADLSPIQVARCLPDMMPIISDMMWDTRPEVKISAKETLTKVCGCAGNADIDPFIPALISSIANPQEVAECVYKLSSTTFVKTVEAPALAIMEPLLSRGLKENKTAVKRQTAVIIDNMCKLLEDPAEAQLFMPKLLPGLQKVVDATADPECREVAARAHKTLFRAGGEVEISEDDTKVEFATVYKALEDSIAKNAAVAKANVDQLSKNYVAGLGLYMVMARRFAEKVWKDALAQFFAPFVAEKECAIVAKAFLEQCLRENKITGSAEIVDIEEGVDLCNCEFSLAYGGMILLNNARLRLKKGKRYGLCGPNGAGKSTLMRAIANGQLEGFPDKSELKTVYVEHVLQAEEADLPVIEFIFNDPEVAKNERKYVVDTLKSVGFSEERQAQAVSSLSGGWKMKLELARAMLMNADILLLDEPTNHLDVDNVKWLENYLTSMTDVTSMIVSHDSGFLDNVCTGIIHYENRKLKTYKGNLSEFVKVRPEARSYYELQASAINFKFPEPGYLADIKNKGKPIMRLQRCAYTYPGCTKPSIQNITVSCSLASRIAVIGPNGAGKSTLIKMLTGEVEPQVGVVTKHPSMRFAYVAQHAFHHIEEHLDISANEYIQWRFQSGEDKELLAKDSRKLTPEEKELMKKPVNWEGEKYQIEQIVSRRKLKKTFEYEVKWEKLPDTENAWIPRERLEKWGFEKLIQLADDREAARANLQARPCTSGSIQKHLDDFGLKADFGTHSRMRGLSGGQKVKVVLAAAMWQNPHILVLDEPTNYLDRDSLGALAQAIKDFGGGVVMISHNREFTSTLAQETWLVNDGKLQIEGQQMEDKTKIELKEEEETFDAFGNVVKTKIKHKLSRKEKKAKEKRKKEALARGDDPSSSEDED